MTATKQTNDTGEDQQQRDPSRETNPHHENDQTDRDDEDADATAAAKEKEKALIETEKQQKQTERRKRRIQRFVRILLVVPYIVGILWTCLHPIVSVITGELKCRGWYLDEHSIETRFTVGQNPQMVPNHLKNLDVTPLRSRAKANPGGEGGYSLCDFFAREGDPGFNPHNLICHTYGDRFEMAMIMPLSNAFDVTEEAVVLVVPSPGEVYPSDGEKKENVDWNSSVFHQAMIRSIRHLADPIGTPWLAKAVLVVTPSIHNNSDGKSTPSLEETVESFLDAYSGPQTVSRDYQRTHQDRNNAQAIPLLPTRLSGAILRNLVVLEVVDNSTKSSSSSTARTPRNTDLSILPQGRRGVLPNADLVFLVGKIMEKTMFYAIADTKTFLTHPYTQESKAAESEANRYIDGSEFLASPQHRELKQKAKLWAKGMIDVSHFAKTLAVGPFPPHAPALERGIDSLTVRVSFEGTFQRDPAVELVQHSEYILRSLANLHERLHHSFTLYLLPTPKAFVSHIEYLLPSILLLVPLAVRVFGMLLPKMIRGLDLTAVGGVLLVVLVAMTTMFFATELIGDGVDDSRSAMAAVLVLLYAGVAVFWVRNILRRKRDHHHRRPSPPEANETESSKDNINININPEITRTILTLQFVTCTLAVYILIPIAFANASLSYLPSVLWTPLLAFPDYASLATTKHDSRSGGRNKLKLVLAVVPIAFLCLLAVATAPPLWLVPGVFGVYTPFVMYAYVPIHVLFFLLVTSLLVS